MFEEIRRNKRNSFFLVTVIVMLLMGVGYAIGEAMQGGGAFGLILAAAIALITSLIGYFSGDRIVLAVSGAKQITKQDSPQLFNIVEEMSIASGLPMPRIYIIDNAAPNAFATGRKPETASVAVTKGLMEKLNRDELQGVVAHELSHIRNYDILYATLVGVLIGTIVLMCDFFLRYTRLTAWGGRGRRRSRQSNRRSGGAEGLLLLLAIVLAILAPLFAKLLQMAVSREREYMADASAAELTRYPEGLASALEKISLDSEPLQVANRATQHLYIVNPIKSFGEKASALFSTHPPTSERIRRLRSL